MPVISNVSSLNNSFREENSIPEIYFYGEVREVGKAWGIVPPSIFSTLPMRQGKITTYLRTSLTHSLEIVSQWSRNE